MLPKVDELSLLENIFPNSFFESFNFQRTNFPYKATWNIKTSVRDFEKKNKLFWLNNPNINKYLYINLALVKNKLFFDSINQDNYLAFINSETQRQIQGLINPEIIVQTKPIINFIGQEATIADKELEFSDIQQNIKIYKFYYDWICKSDINFDLNGTFYGFVTYVSFDVEQYKKDLNLQNFSDDLSQNFIIDKHVFFEEFKLDGSSTANKAKKCVVRNIPATPSNPSEDKIWYKKYTTIGENTLNGKLGGKDVLLKEIDVEIPTFERVLWSSTNLNILTPNITRPPAQLADGNDPVSRKILSSDDSLGDVFTSFNEDGDFKIIFLMDIGKLVLVNSTMAKYVNPTTLKKFVEFGRFKNYTDIESFTVKKKKILDGSESSKNITGKMLENLKFQTAGLGSLVKVIDIKDSDIKYEKTGKYDYTAKIRVKDGLVIYIKALLRMASEEMKKFKEYSEHSENRSYEKKSDGTLKYFNETAQLFNDLFITEQQLPDSYWNKIADSLTAFPILQEFFGTGAQSQKDSNVEELTDSRKIKESILYSLDPSNLKLSILEELIASFDNLINYCYRLLKASNGNILITKEYTLIKNFEADNERYFYKFGNISSSMKIFTNNFYPYAPLSPNRYPVSILKKTFIRQDLVSGYSVNSEEFLFQDVLNFKIREGAKKLLADLYSKNNKLQNFRLDQKPFFFYKYIGDYLDPQNFYFTTPAYITQHRELEIFINRILHNTYKPPSAREELANEIKQKFQLIDEYIKKARDPNFYKTVYTDEDVFLFTIVVLSNFYKLEYLDDLKKDFNGGLLIKGTGLEWKELDLSQLTTIIPKGKSTIIRMVPVKFNNVKRIAKELDAQILNQYFILTNDT
jgi:hypothetical protein